MTVFEYLQNCGFEFVESQHTSFLLTDQHRKIGVVIDTQLYGDDKPNYRYHEYTGWQMRFISKTI
jgi:hypothetical protein